MSEENKQAKEEQPKITIKPEAPKKQEISYMDELARLQKCVDHYAKTHFFTTTQSEKTDQIAAALVEFKKNMSGLTADKMGSRAKYLSYPALVSAVEQELADVDCSIEQGLTSVDKETYVETRIRHESGQFIRSVTILHKKWVVNGNVVKDTTQDQTARSGCTTHTKRS